MAMQISIIVAMTPDRLIGAAGRLPWYLPEDLKRFRKLTTGHAIVMGRKTFSSIGRPLPNRRNLVVSRNPDPPAVQGIEWFKSLDEALEFARQAGETECFIAGGTEIYSAALEKATRMYITYVQRDFPFQGDTYFPVWDQTQWKVTSHELVGKDLEFVTYERSGGSGEQVKMEAGN
ncbi:MAG TPA: dihydrofolate reductase [Phycisphaerae bacterium]|nr:dihydrofolate reductase [Phycisphaerae bacterium]